MMRQLEERLQYGSSIIAFSIVKSRRVKTSEVIVEPDKVVVRTPFNKPLHEIREIVRKKAKWILKKQLEYQELSPQIPKVTFQDGSTLPYLGKNYPLKILQREATNSIGFANGQFTVNLRPSNDVSIQYIKKLYEHWLMKTARPVLKNRVESLSLELAITVPEKIVTKRLKNRWGSIGKNGDAINLNVNLLKTPGDIIDYIILHELCHLKIKEHSHQFWDLVHKFMPNYQDKINWLKINGSNLV